jgi:hypothetical protein
MVADEDATLVIEALFDIRAELRPIRILLAHSAARGASRTTPKRKQPRTTSRPSSSAGPGSRS